MIHLHYKQDDETDKLSVLNKRETFVYDNHIAEKLFFERTKRKDPFIVHESKKYNVNRTSGNKMATTKEKQKSRVMSNVKYKDAAQKTKNNITHLQNKVLVEKHKPMDNQGNGVPNGQHNGVPNEQQKPVDSQQNGVPNVQQKPLDSQQNGVPNEQQKPAVDHRQNIVPNVQQEQQNSYPAYRPEQYPLHVNMTDIIQQYDTKGFANITPINTYEFPYIISPIHVCSGSAAIQAICIVKTSVDHAIKRNAIRETWASRERFPTIRVIFSMGIPKEAKMLLTLQEESVAFKDILLVDFVDDYYNLTLKTMTSLNWVMKHCSWATYAITVDDDIYVAPDLLLSYINNLAPNKAERLYTGHLFIETRPVHNKGKWKISPSEYPFQYYPDYIFGGFVLMSMRTVKEFTVAAMYTKFFKFEDVYLGILASKVGIVPTNNGYVDSKKTVTVSKFFRYLIASHGYSAVRELRKAWD